LRKERNMHLVAVDSTPGAGGKSHGGVSKNLILTGIVEREKRWGAKRKGGAGKEGTLSTSVRRGVGAP